MSSPRASFEVVRRDQPLSVNLVGTTYRDRGITVDIFDSVTSAENWAEVIFERVGWSERQWRFNAHSLQHLKHVRKYSKYCFRESCAIYPPPPQNNEYLQKLHAIARSIVESARSDQLGDPMVSYNNFCLKVIRSTLWTVNPASCLPLRKCGNEYCLRYFVSSVPSKKWCSPKCGNSSRVRKHYWLFSI